MLATRLTYTTESRGSSGSEAALAEARELDAEPLAHLVAGREVAVGESWHGHAVQSRSGIADRQVVAALPAMAETHEEQADGDMELELLEQALAGRTGTPSAGG
jgi:hypothetical protein